MASKQRIWSQTYEAAEAKPPGTDLATLEGDIGSLWHQGQTLLKLKTLKCQKPSPAVSLKKLKAGAAVRR